MPFFLQRAMMEFLVMPGKMEPLSSLVTTSSPMTKKALAAPISLNVFLFRFRLTRGSVRSPLVGDFLCLQAGAVVAAAFGFAGSAFDCSDIDVFDVHFGRSQSALKIRTHRA